MSTYQGHCIIYLYLVVIFCIRLVECEEKCVSLVGSTNKCACTYTDTTAGTSKYMDFTPLGNPNGQAAFAYKDATGDTYKYAYNPCFPFKDNFCTTDTAACQVSQDEQYHYPIGSPTNVKFTVESSDIVITYAAVETRSAVVNFHCDETAINKATTTYTPLGEQSDGYKFTIGTCLACTTDVPNCHGSSGGGGGGGGLTPGGILCIVFTVLLVVYVVGGILFQKYGRGASGKELIPNYGFWTDFPLLVKDGFMFLVGLCKGGSRGSDYESIK